MFNSQVKFAFRSLKKNRLYLIINLIGLVGGTLAALIITKYIGFSMSFDNFHQNRDNIFVIHQVEKNEHAGKKEGTKTYWGSGEWIKNEFAEVNKITRFNQLGETLVTYENVNGELVKFNENKIFTVDSSFLKIFSFEMVGGNPEKLFSHPNTAVITESIASKYFFNNNPLGETLTLTASWGEEMNLIVVGITEDAPKNSTLQYDFLIVREELNSEDYWNNPDYETYVMLKDDIDHEALSIKITNDIMDSGIMQARNKTIDFKLISINDTHISIVEYLLFIVGLFILIISWINFINLSLAQFLTRAKEFSIKKVLGASSRSLLQQLFIEALLISGLALLFTLIIYIAFESYLLSFTNGHLLPLLKDSLKINLIFLSIFVLGTFASSIFPAISFLTKNLSESLRGSLFSDTGLRKVLVIIQISISSILIVSIVIISDQLHFIRNSNKGIELANTLVIKAPKDSWEGKLEKLESFKIQCVKLPFVLGVCSSTTVPSEDYRQEVHLSSHGTSTDIEKSTLIFSNGIDDKFMELYDVDFVAGQNFIPNAYWKNKRGMILNMTAVKALGIEDIKQAIGRKFHQSESGKEYELIGVTNDFHKTSVKRSIRPTAFFFNQNRGHFSIRVNGTFMISQENTQTGLKSLKELWGEIYSDQPFDYFFLEEKYYAQDKEEYYFADFFLFFTTLSIIISCLGLYALSLFLTGKRLKEVGIRKIFGAHPIEILVFLVRDYARLLFLSILIGFPVSYFIMDNWLNRFSSHIELKFGIFSYSFLPLTLIFFGTISFQVIKASLINPIKIIRQD